MVSSCTLTVPYWLAFGERPASKFGVSAPFSFLFRVPPSGKFAVAACWLVCWLTLLEAGLPYPEARDSESASKVRDLDLRTLPNFVGSSVLRVARLACVPAFRESVTTVTDPCLFWSFFLRGCEFEDRFLGSDESRLMFEPLDFDR